MTFQLVCIEPKELTQYKSDMQEAFQKGFEDAFGKTDAVILPEKDIDQSVNAEGSAVYKAVVDGEMVGGAVVIMDDIRDVPFAIRSVPFGRASVFTCKICLLPS